MTHDQSDQGGDPESTKVKRILWPGNAQKTIKTINETLQGNRNRWL